MLKILTLMTILLYVSISSDLAYFYEYSSYLTKEDLECMKYFGIKKLFTDSLRDLTLINKNMPTLPDIYLQIYGTSSSPSAVLAEFSSQYNSSQYQMVWLYTYNATRLDCSILKTYVYYCSVYKLNCGFQWNDQEWQKYFGDDRTACPEIATLPLFYNGRSQNWKPMGGWKTYKYNSEGDKITYCYSNLYQLSTVLRGQSNQQKLNLQQN